MNTYPVLLIIKNKKSKYSPEASTEYKTRLIIHHRTHGPRIPLTHARLVRPAYSCILVYLVCPPALWYHVLWIWYTWYDVGLRTGIMKRCIMTGYKILLYQGYVDFRQLWTTIVDTRHILLQLVASFSDYGVPGVRYDTAGHVTICIGDWRCELDDLVSCSKTLKITPGVDDSRLSTSSLKIVYW